MIFFNHLKYFNVGKPRYSVAASDPAIGRLIEGLDNKIQVQLNEL